MATAKDFFNAVGSSGDTSAPEEDSGPALSVSTEDVLSGKFRKRERPDKSLRLPKGTDKEQVVWDYYIKDRAEQDAVKAKATTKTEDLLNLIDNFQRLYYGVAAGAKEAARAMTDSGGQMSNIPEHVWKGLKREEKVKARDIAKIVAPDFMKNIEENTTIKVFGQEMDAASIPLFATEIAADPLTWIPIGWFGKLAKGGMEVGTKTAKAVGEVALGAEKTANIIKAGENFLVNKVYANFNIGALFNHEFKTVGGSTVKIGDMLENYLRGVETAPGKAEREVIGAMKLGDKMGILNKMRGIADMNQTKQLYDTFHAAADDSIHALGELYSKHLGIDVEDALKFQKVDKFLHLMVEAGTEKIPKEALAEIADTVRTMKSSGAKAITYRLMEQRGIKNAVKSIVRTEKAAALKAGKANLDIAEQIYGEAIKNRMGAFKGMGKDLQANSKALYGLLSEDIAHSNEVIKTFGDDLVKSISGEMTPETLTAVRARFDVLKQRVKDLANYQIDVGTIGKDLRSPVRNLKGMRKSDIPLKALDGFILDLEQTVAKSQVGAVGRTQTQVVGEAKDILKKINIKLKEFGKIREAEFRSIDAGLSASKNAEQQILRKHQAAAENVLKDVSYLHGKLSEARVAYGTLLKKADKFSAEQASKYEKTFSSFMKGETHNRIMRDLKVKNEEIWAKHMETLPPELRPAAQKLREILDANKVRLQAAKLTKGVETLYAPRAVAEKFVDEISNTLPKYRQGAGFLKKRTFQTSKEFAEWAAKNGVEPEKDLFYLVFDHQIAGDLKIARKNFADGVAARFGGEDKIPMSVKKGMDYLFTQGRTKYNNPIVQYVVGKYGKALNGVKFMLTAPNPAFHGRNWMSSVFQVATTNGLSQALNPANYLDAGLIKFGGKGSIKTAEGVKTFDEIRQFLENTGYLAAGYTRGNVERSFKLLAKRYSMANPMRWMGEVFKVGTMSEDLTRTVAFTAGLKNGKTMEQALQAAKDAMFDYNMILSPVDKALDGILGFWTFTRRNLPAQFMAMVNDPKQYSIFARALERVANREKLTAEELDAMNGYDKETYTIFGHMVDGVREFTSLGFTPTEQAYQTLNSVTHFDINDIPGSLGNLFGGRINPLASNFLDAMYQKDLFTKTEFGTSLPPQYTDVIPKKVRDILGLTLKERPKYRAGEEVGTEKVLYGDPNVIFMIRRFPVTSRLLGDAAKLLDNIKAGKTGEGVLRYTTGIRKGEIDVEKAKRMKSGREREALMKRVQEKGGPKPLKLPIIPRGEKKSDEYRSFVEDKKQQALDRLLGR